MIAVAHVIECKLLAQAGCCSILDIATGVGIKAGNEYIQELNRKGFVNVIRKGQGRPNLYEFKVARR